MVFDMPHKRLRQADHYQPVRETVALVLAGGRGSRLDALTENCAKPAISFGGKFRVVDFVLSNCMNSGVRQIGVLTQYKAHSLLRHLQHSWSFLRRECNEFIELLPAQQRVDEDAWYRGTADAVFQNLDILRNHNPQYILVLAGDHVYKMDYAKLINDHVALGRPCTVACIEVPLAQASSFGVMSVDGKSQITAFEEKPVEPRPMPGRSDSALASMGVYVFDAKYLFSALEADSKDPNSCHDFGRNLIPVMVSRGDVSAHRFGMSCIKTKTDAPNYWRDVGTVDSFWSANMDLTVGLPELDLYDRAWPIWASQDTQPPAKFVSVSGTQRGIATDSLVASGCIVSGSIVHRSILSSGVHIRSSCDITEAVILPDASVGENCYLHKVVVDEGCHIPAGTKIGMDSTVDAQRFHRSPQGVVLVTRAALAVLDSKAFVEPKNVIQETTAPSHEGQETTFCRRSAILV